MDPLGNVSLIHPQMNLQDKTASLKDLRTMRNKGVLRLHERLSRDQAKKDDPTRAG